MLDEIDKRLTLIANTKTQPQPIDSDAEILTLLEQLNSSLKSNSMEDLKHFQDKLNTLG
jgi:hypothetical protein